MRVYCSTHAAAAALLLALASGAIAQVPPTPEGIVTARGAATPLAIGPANYTIFLRAIPIGSEQIALTRRADWWSIISSGRLGAPIDAVTRRVEVRYTEDWRPLELTIDATVRGQPQMLHTVVSGTTAQTEFTSNGQPAQKSDAVDPNAVLIVPTSVFAPYEALAQRLKTAAPGAEIPVYNAPMMSFVAKIGESSAQQIQTTGRVIAARRTHVTLAAPAGPIDADIWTDESSRMIRFSVPAQSLEVVREDVAAVSSRSVVISRPNDEAVRIPANGFVLAGTISKPSQPSAAKHPAVVLVAGSGPADRDDVAFGVPILGELAGALADAGFIVVRYDKRGVGQSGGRAESAALAEYAEDVRAAVKALAERKDVDPKRIAVVGHSEGGSIAMIAAAKDKRIAAVALIATPGVTGAEAALAQQQHLLDRSTMTAEEKQAKVDAQKRIHDAVITGKGLDQLPPDVRRTVDNPEFQSILTTDPAKVMPEVHKPILVVQGELDTQVDPSNADRLAALARGQKKPPPVEVVKVPGVNHLLVPAKTGEYDEYSALADRHVSPAVTEALVAWLRKIF